MSTIRVIYHGEAPAFPATDQHPDAMRYVVLDGQVLGPREWGAKLAEAEATAKRAVYGTDDAHTCNVIHHATPEHRGALKSKLAEARAKHMPKPQYFVDAIGVPTRDEINAVLNPPIPSTGTATMPVDSTIPQNSEGEIFMSQAIMPAPKT